MRNLNILGSTIRKVGLAVAVGLLARQALVSLNEDQQSHYEGIRQRGIVLKGREAVESTRASLARALNQFPDDETIAGEITSIQAKFDLCLAKNPDCPLSSDEIDTRIGINTFPKDAPHAPVLLHGEDLICAQNSANNQILCAEAADKKLQDLKVSIPRY